MRRHKGSECVDFCGTGVLVNSGKIGREEIVVGVELIVGNSVVEFVEVGCE